MLLIKELEMAHELYGFDGGNYLERDFLIAEISSSVKHGSNVNFGKYKCAGQGVIDEQMY